MARENRPVLGSISCTGCGGDATVHQTARGAARFLYTRCADCGADQRTGGRVQTRLWFGTDWREGLQPDVSPPNLIDESPDLVTGKAAQEEPKNKPKNEPERADWAADEEAEEPGKAGVFWLVGGALGLVALVLGGGV